MKTGKIVRYVIERGRLVLTLLSEDDTEVEVSVPSDIATILGDDIFHTIYIGADEGDRPIHKITRTLDPASGRFLNCDDEIEYEPEQS
jgi:hypothetical protein